MIKEAGGRALAVKCDVCQAEEEVKRCLGQAIETFGRLDFAFNNAGVEQKQALTAELAVEEWDHVALLHNSIYLARISLFNNCDPWPSYNQSLVRRG
jgi:NAD(P)-dependent dehydrogenase (short-subunit alcohol dehydrogenase family)